MNILGFLRAEGLEDIDAVQYYRCFLPLRKLDNLENVTAKVLTEPEAAIVRDEAVVGRDLYVMSRMYGPNMQPLLDLVHNNGGLLVFDCDDDLTEDYRLVSGRGEAFKQTLGMVDHVTTTSFPLMVRLSEWTKEPPVVLPNYIDCDWWEQIVSGTRRALPGYVIGFSGTRTHWGDWYKAAPAMARIARDFCDVVAPLVQGSPPDYVQYIERIGTMPQVPYMGYPMHLAQFDVVLCAVDPMDRFNAGKSAIKPIEAMTAGALPICSRFDPYVDLMVEENAPIVVVEEESVEGWYEAIRKTIVDREWADTLRATGRSWVRKHYDISVGVEKWMNAYLKFAGTDGG